MRNGGILAIGSLLMLAGCAAPSTSVSVVQPAESSAAAALRRVAVLSFEGKDGPQATTEFESILSRSGVGGQAHFTVVDRRRVDEAVKELKFQRSGLVDPKAIAEFGRFMSVDGVYSGSTFIPPIEKANYTEKRTKCTDKKCKNTSEYTVSCEKKTAQYTIVPRLVDVRTAQVVFQPTITEQAVGESCREEYSQEKPDGQLLGEARAQAFARLAQQVAPHTVNMQITLKSDTEQLNGQQAERFKGGLEFAKQQRMDRACEIWRELKGSGGATMSLSFNLAVCEEAAGNLEAAQAAYVAIDKSLARPDEEVNQALDRISSQITKRAELKRQLEQQRQPQPVQAPAPAKDKAKRPQAEKAPNKPVTS